MAMNIINVGYDSTNYYVLAHVQPILLIDVGFPGTLGKLQHQCKRQGIELSAIKVVWATHYHPDHAGLASELQREGCKLILLENQMVSAQTLQGYFKSPYQDCQIDLASVVMLTNAESRAFLGGMGVEGEIVHTPGHSDDSNTLILDEGAAFTGDLTLPMMADEGSFEAVRESWQQIRAHGGRIVYPGHGTGWRIENRMGML